MTARGRMQRAVSQMTLIATWFNEHRRAQHPLDPHYPLGLLFDASGGRPYCEVALEYSAPCVGKWIVKCYVCGSSPSSARPDRSERAVAAPRSRPRRARTRGRSRRLPLDRARPPCPMGLKYLRFMSPSGAGGYALPHRTLLIGRHPPGGPRSRRCAGLCAGRGDRSSDSGDIFIGRLQGRRR